MPSQRFLFITYSVSLINNWVIKLVPYLEGSEVIVLHIGRLEDSKPPKDLPVKNIDISRLSYQQIVKFLTEFKPSVCVFFNFKGIIEQLLLRICKNAKIKTIYLEHGIITKDVMTFKKIKLANLPRRTRRAYIQIRQYFAYIAHSSNPKQEIYILYEVLRHNKFSLSPFGYYYVFGQRCLGVLKNIFKKVEENENAFIVGYPLFEKDEQAKKALLPDGQPKEGILYVHQPFILDHYSSMSYEEERSFIIKWANKLTSQFGKFTILLHPREDLELYQLLYKNTDIDVVQSPNNYRIFKHVKLVLGHYSTALFYPLYLNITTYVIKYPQIEFQSIFDDFFPCLNLNDEIPQRGICEYPHKSFLIGTHNSYEYIAKVISKQI